MGQDIISWKRIKKLNRALDENFIHASTREHNRWHCVRYDGTAAWVDTIKMTLTEDEHPEHWASCKLLSNRGIAPEFYGDRDSVIEWDRRHEEWANA